MTPDRRPEKDPIMTQDNNNNPSAAPAASQTTASAVQPVAVQPEKGDAAKVEIIEKK
jgi:hypothetical protein